MQITFVLGSANYNGITQKTVQYAQQLAKMNHDVLLVAPTFPISELVKPKRHWFKSPSSHSDLLNLTNHTDLPCLLIDPKSNLKNVDLPNADVLVATDCDTAHWTAPLADSRGVRLHFVQQFSARGDAGGHAPSAYQMAIPHIAVSDWVSDLLHLQYGARVVGVVPHGVERHVDNEESEEAQVQRTQATRPTIGLQLDATKRFAFEAAKKAIDDLKDRLPTMQVLIYSKSPVDFGDASVFPPDSTFYEADSAEIHKIQAQCDVWFYFHQSEEFADEVISALAQGTPVVATTSGDAQKMLSSGGGQLVAIDDVIAMSNALYNICTLPEDAWHALSQNAEHAASAYAWPTVARQLNFALDACLYQHETAV